MKPCKDCGIEKPLAEFKKHSENKDGRSGNCRGCIAIKQREYRTQTGNNATHRYEKTKSGFLMRLYRNMKSRITGVQKAKFYLYEGKTILNKEDFYKWAMNSPKFNSLFDAWEKSGYEIRLAPSVDRINSGFGYEIENMEWVTQLENSIRSKNGATILNLETGIYYDSIEEACFSNNISRYHLLKKMKRHKSNLIAV